MLTFNIAVNEVLRRFDLLFQHECMSSLYKLCPRKRAAGSLQWDVSQPALGLCQTLQQTKKYQNLVAAKIFSNTFPAALSEYRLPLINFR